MWKNNDYRHIHYLPAEVLTNIFQYLYYEDLCRAACVCKAWRYLIRSPDVCGKLEGNISKYSPSISKTAFQLFSFLPSFVTHIKLNFEKELEEWFIDFDDFSKVVTETCPNMKALIFHGVSIRCFRFDLKLPDSLRVLAFLHSEMYGGRSLLYKSYERCNIEVLDFSRCITLNITPPNTIVLPYLKKLRLAGCAIGNYFVLPVPLKMLSPCTEITLLTEDTLKRLELLDLECTRISSAIFRRICKCGIHLTELYVCYTLIDDDDLIFCQCNNFFPQLKIICLRNCNITAHGVISLVESCPSLKHVYVGSEYENLFAICNWEKVHEINGIARCDHYKKVNYLDE